MGGGFCCIWRPDGDILALGDEVGLIAGGPLFSLHQSAAGRMLSGDAPSNHAETSSTGTCPALPVGWNNRAMKRLIELLQDLRDPEISRHDAWRILAGKYGAK
jgi:hypothetical protein